MSGPLKNPRHEAFARELAKGKTRDEAYKAAGYKPDFANAARLTRNDLVLTRVEELQVRVAQKVEVTIESLMEEAEEIRRLAIALEQPQMAAAVSALTLKAKLAGKLNERPTVEVTNNVAFIDAPPTETYEQWAERRRKLISARTLVPAGRSANGRNPGDLVQ